MKKKTKQFIDYTVKELQAMLDKALAVDDSSEYSLDREMKDHSRAHNEWSGMCAKVNKLLHLEELQLKRVTAERIAAIRRNFYEENGKHLAQTYPVEKELLPLDETWHVAMKRVIDLREYADILSGVERRFNNRAWLLIQLAKGKETDFEPATKGKPRKRGGPLKTEEYVL